jgi:hypothetical protein
VHGYSPEWRNRNRTSPATPGAYGREATLLLVRLTDARLTIAERAVEVARLSLSKWPRRVLLAAPS